MDSTNDSEQHLSEEGDWTDKQYSEWHMIAKLHTIWNYEIIIYLNTK